MNDTTGFLLVVAAVGLSVGGWYAAARAAHRRNPSRVMHVGASTLLLYTVMPAIVLVVAVMLLSR